MSDIANGVYKLLPEEIETHLIGLLVERANVIPAKRWETGDFLMAMQGVRRLLESLNLPWRRTVALDVNVTSISNMAIVVRDLSFSLNDDEEMVVHKTWHWRADGTRWVKDMDVPSPDWVQQENWHPAAPIGSPRQRGAMLPMNFAYIVALKFAGENIRELNEIIKSHRESVGKTAVAVGRSELEELYTQAAKRVADARRNRHDPMYPARYFDEPFVLHGMPARHLLQLHAAMQFTKERLAACNQKFADPAQEGRLLVDDVFMLPTLTAQLVAMADLFVMESFAEKFRKSQRVEILESKYGPLDESDEDEKAEKDVDEKDAR